MPEIQSLMQLITVSKYNHFIWIALILPVTFFVSWKMGRWLTLFATTCLNKIFISNRSFLQKYITPSLKAISLFIAAFIFIFFQNIYSLDSYIQGILGHFNATFFTFASILLITSSIGNFFNSFRKKLLEEENHSAAAMFPLLSKISKALAVIFGILFVLKNLGFDIGAIIATLGVGGIAVALAGQKTIENLFGGLVLAIDQPIRVGDVGKFNNIIGTVIDVGLRSTKVRTANRTIITIPNAQLASDSIETFASRDKLLITHNIVVKYESTAEQLKAVIEKIQSILIEHDKIDSLDARTKVVKFDTFGINIEIFGYALTNDLVEYLDIQEDIILKITESVKKETAGFGFPSKV